MLKNMLESPFPKAKSQKPGEIPILRTFIAKFSYCLYLIENRLFWLGGHTWDVDTYLSMYGKKKPLAILWFQLDVSGGFHFQVHRWVATTTLGKTCYKKGLVRGGLNATMR